ncbi:MAG: hypothetical protein JJE30_09055 [Desulfuromonadales bacterium]|nr:hypothetical protein [Desulfuromonadales bacterium]
MMMKRKGNVEPTGLCYTSIYNLEKAGNFLIAAVIRDVSARWQHEKELKERIRVLENT